MAFALTDIIHQFMYRPSEITQFGLCKHTIDSVTILMFVKI